METFDFYNPKIHKGNLPVRVLPYNFIDWFENVTPNFKEETKAEIDYNGLKAGLIYHINNSPITEIACINGDRKIELNENYNQYLWSICYALFIIFDESIHKPITAGTYTGNLDLSNPYVKKANDLFNSAMGLLKLYQDKVFFSLPNPEKYNNTDQYYIERTNGIYSAAMTFILLHEFGHQFYGHLDYSPTNDESKKDEYLADDFAIDKISYNFNSTKGTTFKFGIIATLCSFIFLDNSLSGGDSHPDIDARLTNAMEKLELDELDNMWGFASLAFRIWANHYKIELDLPLEVDNYKQLYYLTITEVRKIKTM
jgi:hypothetical protein